MGLTIMKTCLTKYWKPSLVGLPAVLAGLLYFRALRADNARLAAEAAHNAAAENMAEALRTNQKALAQRKAENEMLAGVRPRTGPDRRNHMRQTRKLAAGLLAASLILHILTVLCW
jgi:hypothetical protein